MSSQKIVFKLNTFITICLLHLFTKAFVNSKYRSATFKQGFSYKVVVYFFSQEQEKKHILTIFDGTA